jgi:[ribosomal protein S5]-alanine N-acetyltransferase
VTTAVLEGPALRLRPPQPSDYPALFDWYNDAERVAPFDRFNVDTFEGFVGALRSATDSPEFLGPRFCVVRRDDGRLLGFVGYYRPHPVLATLDVWYVLGDDRERRKGYGAEAVSLLVDHLFRTESVTHVGATTDVENLASVKLLEKVGFCREGTIRSALYHHARWHDVHVYGLIRSEWESRHPRSGS